MRYAITVCLNPIESVGLRANPSHMQKRPPEGGRLEISGLRRIGSEADGSAGDSLDLRALDAQIAELAGGHAVKLVDGLTVLAPIAEGTCHVHDDPLS